MKKIIYIGSIILAALFVALRFANHIVPYIQFEDEIFYTSNPIVYRDVEIKINSIYRSHEYRIEHKAEDDFVMEAINDNEFIFLDMEFTNHSDTSFAVGDIYWKIKGKTPQGKECNSRTHNMDGRYPYAEAGSSQTYTLVFSLPKNSDITELQYYNKITNMGSISKPLTKAPDFKIIFDE